MKMAVDLEEMNKSNEPTFIKSFRNSRPKKEAKPNHVKENQNKRKKYAFRGKLTFVGTLAISKYILTGVKT